jgi:DNA-binding MurR/RpiR family transcriptional regulator
MENDLLNRIESHYVTLSKSQKKIADYILKNYDKVAFMTASALGEATGVSESTVVRLANALGYEGYPKLQKGLQEAIKTRLTTVQRFELSKDIGENVNYLQRIMHLDIENIRKTIEGLDTARVDEMVEALHGARKVYILGLRSSSVLANYLGFYLNFMLDDVHVAQLGTYDVFDHLLNLQEGDVLVAISFPRYSNKTFEVVDFAKAQGARVIGITDSMNSPLYEMVSCCLTAKYNMNTFIDSLVAPMSLINALIIATSMKKREKVETNFKKLEEIWQTYHIYDDRLPKGKK